MSSKKKKKSSQKQGPVASPAGASALSQCPNCSSIICARDLSTFQTTSIANSQRSPGSNSNKIVGNHFEKTEPPESGIQSVGLTPCMTCSNIFPRYDRLYGALVTFVEEAKSSTRILDELETQTKSLSKPPKNSVLLHPSTMQLLGLEPGDYLVLAPLSAPTTTKNKQRVSSSPGVSSGDGSDAEHSSRDVNPRMDLSRAHVLPCWTSTRVPLLRALLHPAESFRLLSLQCGQRVLVVPLSHWRPRPAAHVQCFIKYYSFSIFWLSLLSLLSFLFFIQY